MPEIVHRLGLQASARHVDRALTIRDELAAWWTRDVTGSGEVGSILAFGFHAGAICPGSFVDWAQSLASLQAYVDLGKGWPHPG